MKNMKLLIDLKNIFARQLPKMPKEYIVKLVFDRNHEAMVILKSKTKIIGGICFRMFEEQKFAEIAFLAVTATEQVKVLSFACNYQNFYSGIWYKVNEQIQRNDSISRS